MKAAWWPPPLARIGVRSASLRELQSGLGFFLRFNERNDRAQIRMGCYWASRPSF